MPEIYSLDTNEIEIESEKLFDEWSLDESEHFQEVEVGQVSAVISDLHKAAGPRPRGNNSQDGIARILEQKSNKWKNRLKGWSVGQ